MGEVSPILIGTGLPFFPMALNSCFLRRVCFHRPVLSISASCSGDGCLKDT